MSKKGGQLFNADKSEAYRGSTLEATKRHQRFEPVVSKAVFVCVRVCVCVRAQRLPVSACVRAVSRVCCTDRNVDAVHVLSLRAWANLRNVLKRTQVGFGGGTGGAGAGG